jgi:hypothetical protein
MVMYRKYLYSHYVFVKSVTHMDSLGMKNPIVRMVLVELWFHLNFLGLLTPVMCVLFMRPAIPYIFINVSTKSSRFLI